MHVYPVNPLIYESVWHLRRSCSCSATLKSSPHTRQVLWEAKLVASESEAQVSGACVYVDKQMKTFAVPNNTGAGR